LLLTLQYFWVKNAYDSVERDILEKSKVCLKEAIDEELFERMDKAHIGVSIVTKNAPTDKILMSKHINEASEIDLGLHDINEYLGYKHSDKRIDAIFQEKILNLMDYVPDYSIQIINDSIREKIINNIILSEKGNNKKYGLRIRKNNKLVQDIIINHTVFVKFDSKRSVKLELLSPVSSIFNEARYIFAISLILMLLIAIILTFQFISMTKDKEFTAFIKDFTRNLAHEMRTPVNDIYMLTTRLMSGSITETEKIAIYQKESLNQCSKLLLAVDNVLLVAKSEQTKILIVKSKVNVPDFIESIVEKYRNNYFQRKNLIITTHYEPKECVVYLDSDLMENTILNLIENAIKYSKESVEITIDCILTNNILQIRIKDNGFGIPEKDKKNIFRIFERGKMENNQQIKGFGIGLSYVQKVVNAHHGKIKILSQEGIGSEFILEIPNRFQ